MYQNPQTLVGASLGLGLTRRSPVVASVTAVQDPEALHGEGADEHIIGEGGENIIGE